MPGTVLSSLVCRTQSIKLPLANRKFLSERCPACRVAVAVEFSIEASAPPSPPLSIAPSDEDAPPSLPEPSEVPPCRLPVDTIRDEPDLSSSKPRSGNEGAACPACEAGPGSAGAELPGNGGTSTSGAGSGVVSGRGRGGGTTKVRVGTELVTVIPFCWVAAASSFCCIFQKIAPTAKMMMTKAATTTRPRLAVDGPPSFTLGIPRSPSNDSSVCCWLSLITHYLQQ